jgi:hypothetical protein
MNELCVHFFKLWVSVNLLIHVEKHGVCNKQMWSTEHFEVLLINYFCT